MDELRYPSLADAVAIHAMLMERTSSPPAALRDEGLLESALMKPRMAAYYEQADLIDQAALLAVGIAQAQSFLDGNKRTAFAVADVFLRINGRYFVGDPLDFAKRLEGLATREGSLEDETGSLASWLRERVEDFDRQWPRLHRG